MNRIGLKVLAIILAIAAIAGLARAGCWECDKEANCESTDNGHSYCTVTITYGPSGVRKACDLTVSGCKGDGGGCGSGGQCNPATKGAVTHTTPNGEALPKGWVPQTRQAQPETKAEAGRQG